MTFKQFGLFAMAWAVVCVAIIEPTWVTPYFNGVSGLELAFSNIADLPSGQASYASIATLNSRIYPTDDHFRVLCLLYFALPCVVYLASHAWQERKNQEQ